MALKGEFILLLLVLSIPMMTSTVKNMTLDEYCYTQLPHSLRKPQAMFSYIRYVRICSNIEIYSECLMSTREAMKTGVTIQTFEKTFPTRYNIFKAGYLFCAEELLDRYDRYKFENEDILRCQHSFDHNNCISDSKMISMGQSSPNSSDLDIAACNASISYYTCLRKNYVECDAEYSYLFTYQLSRLGRACLHIHSEYNELLFGVRCLQSNAVSSLRPVEWWTLTSVHISGLVLGAFVTFLLLPFDNLNL